MKRISGLLLAVAILVPGAARAQKPSDIAETRSADVYLKNAEESTLTTEKMNFYRQAIAAALQGAAKYPNNPKPWLQIGKAYHQLGDFIGADSAFTKAQTMYPGYASEIEPQRKQMWVAVFNSAVKKIKESDAAGGLEMLKLASRLDPLNPLSQQVIGSIYLQTGDLTNAEVAYRAELAALRSPSRKKGDAKKEAEYADMELNAVKALASMMSELNRYADAEALYRELLARDPQNPAVMSNLAITLTRAGKTADANVMYSQLLARTDLTGNQLLNVGIGLHNAQEYDKAAEAFARASALSPFNYDVIDFEVNSRSGVVDALLRSVEGKNAADAKAVQAQMMAQYQKIIVNANRGLELAPADATMMMRLAAAQRGLSDYDVAKKAEWQKAVLATLTRNSALLASISDVQSLADEKTVTLSGTITGLTEKAGSKLTLKFHLLDKDGKSVASKDLPLDVPAKDDRKPFSITIIAPAAAL
ncbi:MAG: tetratricopeptide repeat protein, partial [Longimicrobiales bacterium]